MVVSFLLIIMYIVPSVFSTWTPFEGGFLKSSNDTVDYVTSEERCSQNGDSLALFHSTTNFTHVLELLNLNINKYYWIKLKDEMSYLPQAACLCISVVQSQTPYRIIDVNCSRNNNYICMRNVTTPQSRYSPVFKTSDVPSQSNNFESYTEGINSFRTTLFPSNWNSVSRVSQLAGGSISFTIAAVITSPGTTVLAMSETSIHSDTVSNINADTQYISPSKTTNHGALTLFSSRLVAKSTEIVIAPNTTKLQLDSSQYGFTTSSLGFDCFPRTQIPIYTLQSIGFLYENLSNYHSACGGTPSLTERNVSSCETCCKRSFETLSNKTGNTSTNTYFSFSSLIKLMRVNYKATNKNKRKYISITDGRTSSRAMGFTSITIIVAIIGCIIAMDIPLLVTQLNCKRCKPPTSSTV